MLDKLGYDADIFENISFLDTSEMKSVFAGACLFDCQAGCLLCCQTSCFTCGVGCSNGPDAIG